MQKTGQDYIKNPCGSSIAGFNLRQGGHSYNETFHYPHERTDGHRHGGWELADRLIDEGKIFFLHNFHSSHGGCPNGFAFPYGSTWACNTCNNDHLDKSWWAIKVMKDGDAWCCVGEEFINLQESDCYAFGDTKKEAIENYGTVMCAA
ncbi:MAG: hypothetical protein COB36_10835 [Alphaproteobacteria bacterium]|nr:MAG: hypothetical protein COB36_10835 [Alphaproteobacteria bacterium]